MYEGKRSTYLDIMYILNVYVTGELFSSRPINAIYEADVESQTKGMPLTIM